MHFFYSPHIFFAIRDSHIADIKLKNTFRSPIPKQILPLKHRVQYCAQNSEKTEHSYTKNSPAYTRKRAVQKKNKAHTYKLYAVRKGCTLSHKIRTQAQNRPTHVQDDRRQTHRRISDSKRRRTHATVKKTFHVLEKCFFLAPSSGKSFIANTSR